MISREFKKRVGKKCHLRDVINASFFIPLSSIYTNDNIFTAMTIAPHNGDDAERKKYFLMILPAAVSIALIF